MKACAMHKFSFAQRFSIAGRAVGQDEPTYIIAEAGVAHFGSLEKAKRLVDLAVDAKADAVKFQIFKTEELVSGASEEWRNRLSKRELPYEAFAEIKAYCDARGITFFATAHDRPSLGYLAKLDVPAYKIGSGEVGNWGFLAEVASKGKPVILSTGMYSMDQVGEALRAMAATGNREIAVLHCVTRYPVAPGEVNLRAIQSIRDNFDVVSGYSDHTRGFHFPLAAAALGARVIEKHITLDYDVPDAQDWKVSCGVDDLHLMVAQIREIEAGLGSGEKTMTASEREGAVWARKSLVAARDICIGEVIDETMLAAKRPGTGIEPCKIGEVLGRSAREDIPKDSIICMEKLS
ncbi:N-acetylneuraminic acid synthase domain-containing protein [Alkalidesulfovibrio alkalitolerans DSM 16529]|uniref:N-acetylneuraminic acid synthase domain-containing protein n=1 Tax=Alkalidesulfovibrio alkalitolerans DSM 16529 TaxID=1121439 RepID=S7UT93_9BACT|nr:N-acetylneuraminic acid synthase domain-containing protein [Alkalidesulfovibrio alkalitolerans DSM 16529]